MISNLSNEEFQCQCFSLSGRTKDRAALLVTLPHIFAFRERERVIVGVGETEPGARVRVLVLVFVLVRVAVTDQLLDATDFVGVLVGTTVFVEVMVIDGGTLAVSEAVAVIDGVAVCDAGRE